MDLEKLPTDENNALLPPWLYTIFSSNLDNSAQKYKLELMSRCRTTEEQHKYLYENVGNSDFRRKLIQMSWDKGDYEEVLRLAKDGVTHDADLPGLIDEWHKWEYRVYCKINDKDHSIQLARYFFFNRECSEASEFSRKLCVLR